MTKNNISFISNIIVPLLTGIVTMVLFLLFQPEDAGALFYTNLTYTLLLEGIFFGYLNCVRRRERNVSGAFYSIMGIGAVYYMIGGTSWMAGYSLLMSGFLSYNVYIAVHIIMLLLFVILSSLITQTDNNYQEQTEKQMCEIKNIRFYTEKMKLLASTYLREGNSKGCDLSQSDGYKALGTLIIKISHLTPAVFRNNMAVGQLNGIVERCENILTEMQHPDADCHTIDRQLKQFSANAEGEINLLRNLSRK
ncbi:hypothetical protein [uncultured Bacteroides sp.]|uniref:hypothetical protein n=1 Tax=uncultured Bacteroides sp. TaxID=162156 RepID=UPI0025DF6489|nr:hypothetical protein [uncultured Bacteroides sp.]